MVEGWGSSRLELGSRFGWNFFSSVRHWDKEMKDLLPPVYKLRLRTVEYYNEVPERYWNFETRKEEFHPKFDGAPQKEGGPNTRMKQVIYRLPWLTFTNTYHTKLDEQRHTEFVESLNRDQAEHIADRVG